MNTAVWLAILSTLISIIGGMVALSYRDIARRLSKLEHADEKLKNAVFTLLISKGADTDKLADALHSLLTNGV